MRLHDLPVSGFDTTLSHVYRVMAYGIYPVFGLALLLAISVGGTWARVVMFVLGLLLLAYGWTMARNLRGVLERTLAENGWLRVYGSNAVGSWRIAGAVLVLIGSVICLGAVGVPLNGR